MEKHHSKTAIKDVKIKNSVDWQKKIFAQLDHYKKKARYYSQVMALLEVVFSLQTDSIVKLDAFALEKIFEYLDIPFKYSIFSEMDLKIEEPQAPDEWALNISKALGADEYINLPGGENFFDRNKYEKEGIKDTWRHHTGHGIGTRIHEPPFIDVGEDIRLKKNMVFSIEPGIYVKDYAGFRHSDTIVVKKNGLERLTYYPRDLENNIINI